MCYYFVTPFQRLYSQGCLALLMVFHTTYWMARTKTTLNPPFRAITSTRQETSGKERPLNKMIQKTKAKETTQDGTLTQKIKVFKKEQRQQQQRQAEIKHEIASAVIAVDAKRMAEIKH